ncbi:uncharacterized protein LOC128983991 [Macrosteles quadrilineatus]|uniref:uncharacterized protein LOC128983991 n=1 Tax=Macrosteles quadrilineatus TaxID=74068 RepID=UPI0023E125AD|nr:uncharacterized protein LOC128983991 [Macrosteles quadrilineatus]
MAFLSIPFAKPPLGPLRFEPPQPIDPWPNERLAVLQPRTCPQILDPTSSEDCLYLNIYTPDKDTKPLLPVIVFYFGGALEIGGIYGYTPEFLLDEDIILVLVQYRLGLFGFLSTGDTVVPGNMGFKDMRLGLRWVKDNIRYFGGDPEKITIAGESAGSVGVHYLMTFSAHEGLFRAGISQSGTALFSWAFHPPEEIRKMVVALAVLSGCPSDTQGLVACLREKPAADLVLLYTGLYKTFMYFDFEFFVTEVIPLIGGVIEPECVEDRLITGNPWDFNTTTPWLVGVNSKEALIAFTVEENDKTDIGFFYINSLYDFYFPFAVNYVNSKANGTAVGFAARDFYLHNLPISRLTLPEFIDLSSDAIFIYPTYEAVKRANKEQTYVYIFDHVGPYEYFPVPPDTRIGAAHADDLFYFFPHPAIPFPTVVPENDPLPNEQELSKTLVRMYANFATCLNPTPMKTCEIQWKPFFPNETYLHIKQFGFEMKQPFLPERMEFWSSHEYPYRNDNYAVRFETTALSHHSALNQEQPSQSGDSGECVEIPQQSVMMYRCSSTLVVLLCGMWGASAFFAMDSPRVEVAGGKLRGKFVLTKENKRIRAFMGIPYAKPPVAELRFKSPEPSEPWEGERWALDIPSPCIQAERRHGEPIGKEDCLYLNVFTPESVEKRIMAHMNLTVSKNSTNSNTTSVESAKATLKSKKDNETMSNDILDNTVNGAVLAGANTTVASGNATVGNVTVGNATANNATLGNSTTNGNGTNKEPAPRMCLPVMVFFHGGGFETGSSGPFTHEYLLDADIILVTVQYRLGLLGFLSTGDTVLPGNLGLKDQRLALQWVRENIEKFGGCPDQVTIVGDGAGGASVHYHVLFAQPKNESFRAGISMSGTALSPWAFRPPSEVAHMVDSLARITHCPRESEEFAACMWNMRAEDFVVVLQKYKNETLGGCGEWALSLPVVGGVLEDCRVEDAFITANPWDKKVNMPWMVGVTGKEMLYEFTEQLVDRRDKAFPRLEKCFNESLPNALGYSFSNASTNTLVENIRKFYFKDEPISRDIFADIVEAVSDGSVVYPTFEAVRRAARKSTWLYHFNYIGSNTYGASALDGRIAPGRGDDLFYFFPRPLGKNVPRKTKEPDMVISKKLVTLWTNFVIHLDPTPTVTPDGVKWVSVAPSTTFLNIGQSVMVVERPFYSYRMNFWSMEDFPHRDDVYGNGLCLMTDEPEPQATTDEETPLVLPNDFYPALKWTLKNGPIPQVDMDKESGDNQGQKENITVVVTTTTTTPKPTLVPEVYTDSFYPALRWTLKAGSGWRPLVDNVGDLSNNEVVTVIDDPIEAPQETEVEEVTEEQQDDNVTEVPDDFDVNFYPALRWTLKQGWRPLVDTVGSLSETEATTQVDDDVTVEENVDDITEDAEDDEVEEVPRVMDLRDG